MIGSMFRYGKINVQWWYDKTANILIQGYGYIKYLVKVYAGWMGGLLFLAWLWSRALYLQFWLILLLTPEEFWSGYCSIWFVILKDNIGKQIF